MTAHLSRSIDGRGHEIRLDRRPERIVSLVPSTTETLHHLGCEDRVVGVTRFCVHPQPWVRSLPLVGGTKDVDIQRVRALKPDLVLGNCEENTREIFAALEPEFPVYASFPKTVDQAIDDLGSIGRLLQVEKQAEDWRVKIQEQQRELRSIRQRLEPFSYAYLIWRDPWMSVSNDTFIASMLAEAGGTNALGSRSHRFPTLTNSDLMECGADLFLLSSEPFPFRPRHREEIAALGISESRVRFVNGEFCSWHGVRMRSAMAYLADCLQNGWPQSPESHPRKQHT